MIRPTTDALLLSAACPLVPGDHFLDLGSGDGSIALLALPRVSETYALGMEWQSDLESVALLNAAELGLSERFQHQVCDVLTSSLNDLHHRFDCVVSNPPFFGAETARRSPESVRKLSRSAARADIKGWVHSGFKFLKPKGYIAFVWPSNRLADLTNAIGTRASHLLVLPIRFNERDHSVRVILIARKAFRTKATPEVFLMRELSYFGESRETIHGAIHNRKISLWAQLRSQGWMLPNYLQNHLDL